MTAINTQNPVKLGSRWKQVTFDRAGKKLTRIVEVIAAPTLSNAAGIRIIRNDKHTHRKGKTASIRTADLLRKYEAVAA